MLTFYRKEPFTLTAKYVTKDSHITDPFIGTAATFIFCLPFSFFESY